MNIFPVVCLTMSYITFSFLFTSQYKLFTVSYLMNFSRLHALSLNGRTPCASIFYTWNTWGVHFSALFNYWKWNELDLSGCSMFLIGKLLSAMVVSSLLSFQLSFSQNLFGAPSCIVLRKYRGCTSFLCQHSSLIRIHHPDHSSSNFFRA